MSDNLLQQRLAKLAEPLAASLGLEILLIEDVVEQGRRTLRFYLDSSAKKKEISLDDCAKFSRLFSPILEDESGLGEKYNLEVSSPGLNRPLVQLQHFEQQVGKVIKLVLKEALSDRKKLTATLVEIKKSDKYIFMIMESQGQRYEVPFDLIKKANLDYFASEER